MSDFFTSAVRELQRNSEKETERKAREAALKKLEAEHRAEERRRLDSDFLIEPTGLNFEKRIEPKAKQNEAPVVDSVSKSNRSKARTRKTNLIRAIECAVSTFSSKPSFEELWKYFQDDKDETGFIEDFSNEKLTWRDTKGNLHDVKQPTVKNHLSRIKS